MYAAKYTQFSLYHEHSSINPIVELGKSSMCFVFSSSKWVINSSAIDHMMGDLSLFSTFLSHTTTSNSTLADGSTLFILVYGIVNPTPYSLYHLC